MTQDVCAKVSTDLRRSAANLGVRLPPTCDLEQLIRETEWLSTLKPEEWVGEVQPAHQERFVQALLKVEQAARLAATLELLSKVRNHDQLLRWLRKRLDRTTTLDATAQDYLFEMEMAVRLTRLEGLSVSLEEPDILVTLPSGNSFALASSQIP